MPHSELGWVPDAVLDAEPTRFYARGSGLFEWICPFCTAINRSLLDPADARLQCIQPGCRRIVGVGLRYAPLLVDPAEVPPFNGFFTSTVVAPDGTLHNRRAGPRDLPDGAARAICRLSGPVEWRCDCGSWNVCYADWTTGRVVCSRCPLRGFVSALLVDVSARRRRTPIDWMGVRSTPTLERRHAKASRSLRGVSASLDFSQKRPARAKTVQ